MLMQLLALIGRGGIQRPSDLAAELDTSSALVEQMLADLERLGYLSAVGDDCRPAAGAHCPAACPRPAAGGNRMWTLTARGARVAGQ